MRSFSWGTEHSGNIRHLLKWNLKSHWKGREWASETWLKVLLTLYVKFMPRKGRIFFCLLTGNKYIFICCNIIGKVKYGSLNPHGMPSGVKPSCSQETLIHWMALKEWSSTERSLQKHLIFPISNSRCVELKTDAFDVHVMALFEHVYTPECCCVTCLNNHWVLFFVCSFVCLLLIFCGGVFFVCLSVCFCFVLFCFLPVLILLDKRTRPSNLA